MARTVSLALLRTQARDLADMDPSGSNAFVDDTEATRMVNGSLGIWHGMVALAVPERFEATQVINANGSTTYALPADHAWTLGVDYDPGGGVAPSPLRRLMFQERNRYGLTTSAYAEGYRLTGSSLSLHPAPSSGTYNHVYVTAAPVLASDGDTIDGVNGWEQWIVLDVAIKMRIKEESAVGDLVRLKAEIEERILAAAADREAANPQRVVDVREHERHRFGGLFGLHDPDFWA